MWKYLATQEFSKKNASLFQIRRCFESALVLKFENVIAVAFQVVNERDQHVQFRNANIFVFCSPRFLEMLNIDSVCAVGRVHGLSFTVVFSHNLKLL